MKKKHTSTNTERNPLATITNFKGVVITLERTPCYGLCPVYKLTIYGKGRVVYEGEMFVKVTGKRTSTVSKRKIRQLISEFERIDYYSLKDSYEEYFVTDSSSALTSITIDGETKAIAHYHGDINAPEELSELEDKIDETIGSNRWIRPLSLTERQIFRKLGFEKVAQSVKRRSEGWYALGGDS